MSHIARHNVTPEEVEEVCHSSYVAFATYSSRIILIGKTHTGKVLSIVLAPKSEGIYYVVTARPASRKERRHYYQQKGGEKAA